MSEVNKNEEVVNENNKKVNKKVQKSDKNDEIVNKDVKKLTAKQQKFVDEYLIDLNATQAAIRAGYSKKYADRQGHKLVEKSRVSEKIQEAMNQRQKRTEITQDMIVQELAKIAFSNATDYAEIVTRPIKHKIYDEKKKEFVYVEGDVFEQDIVMKDTKQLTNDQKAAISCIKNTKHGIAIEQCNKVEALHLLGQHLGMFKNNQPVIVNNNVPNPYDGLSVEDLEKLAKWCEENGET